MRYEYYSGIFDCLGHKPNIGKRSIRFSAIKVSAFMVLVGLGVSPAKSDDWLISLEGSWNGIGAARSAPDITAKKLKCRIKGKGAGVDGVKFSGRCASVKKRGKFEISIKSNGGKPHYSARARSAIARVASQYAGTRQSERLSLTSSSTISRKGQKFRSSIFLNLVDPGKLIFTEELTNLDTGENFEAVRTIFTKK